MNLLRFSIGFLMAYGTISWTQKYVKTDLTWLKRCWIIFAGAPGLHFIVLLFAWYYTTIALLVKMDVLEYVEE